MYTIYGTGITSAIRKLYKWVYIPKMDVQYFLPTRDFVMNQIISCSMKEIKWRPETCDCDNIAVILWGKIEERECLEKWQYCMPFGVSVGKLSTGQYHMTNCFYSDQGFEFYDVVGIDLTGFKPSMIIL